MSLSCLSQLCFEKNLPLTLQPIYIILVYRCHVIGPRDAGKTTFAQGLLDRSLQDIEGIKNEELPCHVINTVQVYGQEKYLVLQDIDVKSLTDMLSPIDLHCDVCCLVYDISNPRSFEFVARIFLVCYLILLN